MRYLTNIIQLFFIVLFQAQILANPFDGLDDKITEQIKNKQIYRKSVVNTKDKIQSFDYKIYGIHPNTCTVALRKLSQYEKFHEFIDIVKLSGYNEKKQRIYLYLDSTIMPFPMSLEFTIERIKKPGTYKFSFDKGYLKGLLGTIHVIDYNSECLFISKASWKGEESKIPDSIFEMFTETLGELAMKNLFRVSKQF